MLKRDDGKVKLLPLDIAFIKDKITLKWVLKRDMASPLRSHVNF